MEQLTGYDLLVQDAIDRIITECRYNEKLIKQTIRDRYFQNVDTLSYHWAKKANNIRSRIHFLRHQQQINNTDTSSYSIAILKIKNEFL